MISLNLEDIESVRINLMPLTLTRPVGALLCGIADTVAERWQRLLPGAEVGYLTAPYLAAAFPAVNSDLTVAAHVLPTPELAERVAMLAPGQYLTDGSGNIVARRGEPEVEAGSVSCLQYQRLTDIFRLSKELLTRDFDLFAKGRQSQPLSESCTLIGPADRLFIEEGAQVEGAFINTLGGPVYIGRRAEVQEAVVLRGPLAIGPDCRVRAGARLLPGVNLGPVNRVGGEIGNTVFLGHSNKQHDGYLGDAVIGHWVNIGGGTVSSNLKNNYAEIRLWNYGSRRFERTGLTFCGLIMGDHSKCAISTTFNTATVVGVGCNIHGFGYPRPFVASFTDGGLQTTGRTPLKQVLQVAEIAMSDRGMQLSQADIDILTHLYSLPDA